VSRGGLRGGSRGSITLWLLGLAVMLLALGGLAVDLGRAFSARQALAAAADAAALAGAGALDEARYRADGMVVLDPVVAEARARRSLEGQLDRYALDSVSVHADRQSVTVSVVGTAELTLLRLVPDGGALTVRVTATARPHLRR